MIYMLDTNIIRKLLFHFPKKGKLFEEVWASLDAGIEAGTYISVDECFNELSGQFSKDNDAFKWINERKRMFKNPDGAETLIIRELFKDPKMRESIHTKRWANPPRPAPSALRRQRKDTFWNIHPTFLNLG